jgi:hypothetical protein
MQKLLLALFFTNLCLAQGFIEVEVRDTLMMKPIAFVYEVSLSEQYDHASEVMAALDSGNDGEIDAAKEKNDKKNARTRKFSELEQFLIKNKYAFEPSKNYDINSYMYGSFQKSYLVKVKTPQALDKLTEDIEKMEHFSGAISNIDYGNPEALEAKLMDKLLKKAKTKATMISGMTNQKLGAITEFRELKASDNLNYTVVDLILSTRKKNTRDFFKQTLDGELSKTVIVRFKTE